MSQNTTAYTKTEVTNTNMTSIAMNVDNTTVDNSESYFSDAQITSANICYYVIFPILLSLGTVGNALNLCVLWRIRNKTSTTVYLVFVAVADIVILWMVLPEYYFKLSDNLNPAIANDSRYSPFGFDWKPYRNFDGIRRWIEESAIQVSDWTLLLFSLERLLKSVKPLYFREFITLKSALLAECVLVVLSGIFMIFDPVESYYCLSHVAIDQDIKVCHDQYPWILSWKMVQRNAEMFVMVFKYIALATLNTALACSLYRSFRADGPKFPNTLNTNGHGRRIYQKSNVILLASTLLYITTQLPMLAFNIVDYRKKYLGVTYDDSIDQFVFPLVSTLFYTNYAVNFYLYFGVSKRFRDELRKFSGKWSRRPANVSGGESNSSNLPPDAAAPVPPTPYPTIASNLSQITLVSNLSMSVLTNPNLVQTLQTISETESAEDETDWESVPTTPETSETSRLKAPRFSIGDIELLPARFSSK